ncbi:MAG: pantetheine-phosphate adenylyltransferase [Ruminococcaceae bacterium]|nr:pantetheine-phosphate adenylyltransferase [Oscillospiraceae bacterium]
MSIAIVPGSFDPITLGHLDIIKRALAVADEVVVAVMNNDAKVYTFDMETRAMLARLAVADLANVRVVADDGMLVDLFDRLGADVIVKGVRNDKDRAYEQRMAAYNLAQNPRAKTLLLDADPALSDLSSTRVRAALATGACPRALLPEAVAEALANKE